MLFVSNVLPFVIHESDNRFFQFCVSSWYAKEKSEFSQEGVALLAFVCCMNSTAWLHLHLFTMHYTQLFTWPSNFLKQWRGLSMAVHIGKLWFYPPCFHVIKITDHLSNEFVSFNEVASCCIQPLVACCSYQTKQNY
jgi:hypothetical protein